MHRSQKYENAPMPYMQRFDEYGTALMAVITRVSGQPRLHRLPSEFAKRLYGSHRRRRDGNDRGLNFGA
jgi:hypothetical protein